MSKLIELIEQIRFSEENRIVERKTDMMPAWAIGKLRFRFGKGDTKNQNARIYPSEILSREVKKLNDKTQKASVIGNLDHPINGNTELAKASHAFISFDYDEKAKEAWATAYILDTDKGRDLSVLLNSPVSIGASMRGHGNVGEEGKVLADYSMSSVDIVANPSFGADVRVSASNVFESINSITEKENDEENMEKVIFRNLTEEEIVQTMELAHEEDVAEGRFDGSLSEWREKNEQDWRRKLGILIEEEKEEELREMREKALSKAFDAYKNLGYLGNYQQWKAEHSADVLKLHGLLPEAKEEKPKKPRIWTTADVMHEANAMGVEPRAYAERLNQREAQLQKEKSIMEDDNERARILRAAYVAGQDISNPAKRLEILERWSKPIKSEVLTEEEKKALKAKLDEAAHADFKTTEKMISGAASKSLSLEEQVKSLAKSIDSLNERIKKIDEILNNKEN